jgi:hypothetical protein
VIAIGASQHMQSADQAKSAVRQALAKHRARRKSIAQQAESGTRHLSPVFISEE